jgi:hypothetical protein
LIANTTSARHPREVPLRQVGTAEYWLLEPGFNQNSFIDEDFD